MPAKRAKAKQRTGHITPEAAAAFLAGDGLALRRALRLRPWEFTISPTADAADAEGWSVEKLMAHREQIEVDLRNCP